MCIKSERSEGFKYKASEACVPLEANFQAALFSPRFVIFWARQERAGEVHALVSAEIPPIWKSSRQTQPNCSKDAHYVASASNGVADDVVAPCGDAGNGRNAVPPTCLESRTPKLLVSDSMYQWASRTP
ncbi:hypothetical protein CSUB01_05921 [Colletotrichum sublineola]|uniref:Uncharacterized protein n=1 Tax=Colletotrichum sublineola TaxID=1173701 RepID=A0A066XF36_COLSU|nr:hypothetical protein CSUB01_05921 [Colletotrichum sublineola]